jgi:hypothetical protein
MAGISFAADIQKLFRDYNVQSMIDYGIDLSQYGDVKVRAKDVYARLVDGDMPCDVPWG